MPSPLAVKYSFASPKDFDAILKLQGKHLFAALDEVQRRDGFLTVEFTREMLQEVINDLIIVTAYVDNRLIGYHMAQTIAFNLRFALLRKIIDRFSEISFLGRALSESKVFIWGPVCIASDWRGKGIHEVLFRMVCEYVTPRYEVGVTFISEDNPRSLAASQSKLGMQIVDKILFNERRYCVLAFATKCI